MVIRSFHIELENVKKQLLEMGEQIESILKELITSFQQPNNAMTMQKIINNDEKVNEMELALHDKVTILISKQQPVATDLRVLIVVLKISSDLERIADLAVDMAKQTMRLNEDAVVKAKKEKIVEMFVRAEKMIAHSLEAFAKSDMLMAQKIAAMDDEVDDLYGEFIRQLFSLNPNEIEVDQVTQLAFIGRYIERMADYATNIAEWVVYEVNGKHFDLN